MIDLLLDDEDYEDVINDIVDFAKRREDIEYDGTTQSLVNIALVMMMALSEDEEDTELYVLLGKLIYNIGYRDSLYFFAKHRSQVIH